MVSILPVGPAPISVPLFLNVTVYNAGDYTETQTPVLCRILHNDREIYHESPRAPRIRPGHFEQIHYPPFTPLELGSYLVICSVLLPEDEAPQNDTLYQFITVVEPGALPDVWTKDNPSDDGTLPSPSPWFWSPDLWVRRHDDGGTVHQDPIAGRTNTVYVRLRNRGQAPVLNGVVNVYWFEPAMAVLCDDLALIGVIPFTNLLPGEQRIVKTSWVPSRTGYTCLFDMIDAPLDPYDRRLMCAPLYLWVPWDNNVEMHNLNILPNPQRIAALPAESIQTEVRLVNPYTQDEAVDVIVERMSFPTTGTITLKLPDDLFDYWYDSTGGRGAGIEVVTATKEIQVTGPVSATVGAIAMYASEAVTLGLRFDGPPGQEFELNVSERIDDTVLGGVGYQWVIPDTTLPAALALEPADNAHGIRLDAPLIVTFNEPVGPLSLELSVSPNPGGWSYHWSDSEAMVVASHHRFAPGVTYHAAMRVSDAAGNRMPAPVSWSFTTIQALYLPTIMRGP